MLTTSMPPFGMHLKISNEYYSVKILKITDVYNM